MLRIFNEILRLGAIKNCLISFLFILFPLVVSRIFVVVLCLVGLGFFCTFELTVV